MLGLATIVSLWGVSVQPKDTNVVSSCQWQTHSLPRGGSPALDGLFNPAAVNCNFIAPATLYFTAYACSKEGIGASLPRAPQGLCRRTVFRVQILGVRRMFGKNLSSGVLFSLSC
jgi:hypothetical protein